MKRPAKLIIEQENFHSLLDALTAKGYQLFGPTPNDNAIIYDQIESIDDLPVGWTDKQSSGSYRLVKSREKSFFGYVPGPHSWKKFLIPPVKKIWEARRERGRFETIESKQDSTKRAFIGVRSCELHAMAIQDKVFIDGPYVDPSYQIRRKNLFIVAVNCVRAGGTCFCSSMNTGPKVTSGFDLALTELIESDRHYFVVETGSERGAELAGEIPGKQATEAEVKAAEEAVNQAAANMGRALDTSDLKDLLYRNFDSLHWQTVADRCLSCGNCTMVCPTCFCTNTEEVTDLPGELAERRSQWDSCFSIDFSYIHGGSVRATTVSRYRQWMMHKLAYWVDQFGTFGCVGCGRCITWCPVGIDITEEARAIREQD